MLNIKLIEVILTTIGLLMQEAYFIAQSRWECGIRTDFPRDINRLAVSEKRGEKKKTF